METSYSYLPLFRFSQFSLLFKYLRVLKEEGRYMNDDTTIQLKVANAWEWMDFEKQQKAKIIIIIIIIYLECTVTFPSTGM